MRLFIILLTCQFFHTILCQNDPYICGSCKGTDITRFKNVVQCECSPSDALISNRVLCLKNNEPINCKGFTGKCCSNNNETCPLCSKNDFTRNLDCGCRSLNLKKKQLQFPVTKILDKIQITPAFCCDDTEVRTTELPPSRKKIIPKKKSDWKKSDQDLNDD